MQKVNLGQTYNKPMVVALGFFDCMHKGHMSLIDSAKKLAKQFDCQCAAFTFSNNHLKLLNRPDKLIYTFDERVQIFENLGLDVVLYSQFDRQFMSMTADNFLQKLFEYDIKAIVCGFDYTCGSDMKNCQYVQKFANSRSTICDIVAQISYFGQKMSSTLVKKLLEDKQITQVNSLLSENYFISGKVVDGSKIGRTLGFPTANLLIDKEKLLVEGVYCCKCNVDGRIFDGILNIGKKPTFGVDEVGLEVHLKAFNGNLYGKTLKIVVTKFLRNTKKFENRQQLVEQLKQDLSMENND